MPTNNPLQNEIEQLNRIQDKISFKAVQEKVDEIEQAANSLPGKLGRVREGGYCFKKSLESTVQSLSTQWRTLYTRVQDEQRKYQTNLQKEANNIRAAHAHGATAGSALSALEDRADAAVRSLEAIYTSVGEQIQSTQHSVDDIAWTLNQLGQASFQLAPGELAFEAVPANWKKTGDKDGVDGVLYLTDQRLIFEQKEEVATRKVLFIATEKQKLQSLQWAIPAARIDRAVGSKKGFMNKDDFLTLDCSAGAPFQTTELHLKGESGETWSRQIQQVKSGAINAERIGSPAAPNQETDTFKWGAQVLLRLKGEASQVQVYGNYGVSGANQDSEKQAWLRQLLIQKVIDKMGELSAKGYSLDQFIQYKEEISATVRAALQDDFARQGFKLVSLEIEGFRQASA